MGLEAGVTYIEDLVATNPVGATDNVDEGDDHIRNIKTAVKGSFPNLGNAAVTKTAAQVNALATLTGSETLTNKTLTSPVVNTGISGTGVLDEDDLVSDSATKIATQQSIKAYADNVIQVLESNDATYQSIASVIARDDTIPTVSEGAELLTQAITPVYSTSKIEISFDIPAFEATASPTIVVTIVDKTGASVLRTYARILPANALDNISGSVLVASPGTSANTYSIRIGIQSGTVYINGDASARLYGGSLAVRLTVKEIT